MINTETNEIYDPTYMANGSDSTLEMFAEGYKVLPLIVHAVNVDSDLAKRLVDFLPESEKQIALKQLTEAVG